MTEQTSSSGPIIECYDVHKWFGSFEALRGISMEVYKGEVIVIFGPSGSGKSTFIRTLNRLEEHQQGRIVIDGIELTKDVRNIEAVRMETGMVFQQFNLSPSKCLRKCHPGTYPGPKMVERKGEDKRESTFRKSRNPGTGR